MCEGEGCVRERGWWGGGATTLHIANYIVINVPVTSEYHKHAQELIRSYDLSETDGIVTLSGDGTISEVMFVTLLEALRLLNFMHGQDARGEQNLEP